MVRGYRARGSTSTTVILIGLVVGLLLAGIAWSAAMNYAIYYSMRSAFSNLFSGGIGVTGTLVGTDVLDGKPINTSGVFAREEHYSLTGSSGESVASHLAATASANPFQNDTTAMNYIKTPGDGVAAGSAFISEFKGQMPVDVEVWGITQRWCYTRCFTGTNAGAKQDYAGKKVIVTNPNNGKQIVTAVMNWGPGVPSRVAGLAPEAAYAIAGTSNLISLKYQWAVDQSVPLGPVTASTVLGSAVNGATGPVSGPSNEAEGAYTGTSGKYPVDQLRIDLKYLGGTGMNTYYARPTYIVLHYLGAGLDTPQQAKNFFQGTLTDSNDKDNKYVHFVVGKDGHIFQLLAETKQPAGACGFNRTPDGVGISINIENVGEFESNKASLQYTQAEVDANIQLVNYLKQKWNIPKSHVVTHQWAYQNFGAKAGCNARSDPGIKFTNAVMAGVSQP